ncbi:hypothetical protein TorRG33x02_332210 [Trema orientale]|uniref:Uncharacterized protein n=1 Tax=Trema orientale TaxID=63057 RepID=A0A2P5B5B3_TREOI|nr:hypothetical protein TorRG33x02_332210 [Trema orientale]
MTKLSNEIGQKWQIAKDGVAESSGSTSNNGQLEVFPQCGAKFPSVTTLLDHVEKVRKRGADKRAGVKKMTIDVCPNCSKNPVSLVEHVESAHGGTSLAEMMVSDQV